MILAVLEARCGISCAGLDVFLNVAGEAQPAVDNQDFYGNDLPKNRRWNRRVVLAILHEGGEIEPENR
jgi:hypothetical protein